LEKYSKIKYIGDSENQSIFQRKDKEIIVTEKVDGANFRVMKEDGDLVFGSRNVSDLDRDNEQFKEVMDYIEDVVNIDKMDEDLIYVGEYMNKHSIEYNWKDIPTFIGFDVLHKESGNPLNFDYAFDKMTEAGFEFINVLFRDTVREWKSCNPNNYMNDSAYRDGKPEGIVIKNYNRLNQYGRPLFAKMVTEDFREKKFANFSRKTTSKKNTPFIIEKYITKARIKKIINKMTVEEGKDLSRELMSNGLYHRVINDAFQEEITSMLTDKKVDKIDVNHLYSMVPNKCLNVLDEMIKDNVDN